MRTSALRMSSASTTMRGPQREAMSSLSGTMSPRLTAVIVDQPARVFTVLADWPQQIVSARKTRFGFDATMYSDESCGYPLAAPAARSAMFLRPNSEKTLPRNVVDVAE